MRNRVLFVSAALLAAIVLWGAPPEGPGLLRLPRLPFFTQPAQAQGGPSRTQIDPGVVAPATNLCTATGATPTCTITIPSGYAYLTALEYTLVCGTTTCTATAASNVSTANLGGAAFTVPSTGWGAAAGTGSTTFFSFGYAPVRSSQGGTNVTVGAFPSVTNGTWRVNAWGYLNPY